MNAEAKIDRDSPGDLAVRSTCASTGRVGIADRPGTEDHRVAVCGRVGFGDRGTLRGDAPDGLQSDSHDLSESWDTDAGGSAESVGAFYGAGRSARAGECGGSPEARTEKAQGADQDEADLRGKIVSSMVKRQPMDDHVAVYL